MFFPTAILLSAVGASAAPALATRQTPFEVMEQAPWSAGATNQWQIHASCNASERMQLEEGLAEAVQLATHAKAHINRWGNNSEIYQKYFGNAAPQTALGAYDVIISGDRAGALFRCDDPDGNCANMPTWAGHWRGNNATGETVICPPSYVLRQRLSQVCSQGYNVRESRRTLFWASDLIHRLFHMPAFGHLMIEHYAEGWDGIVEAAASGSPNATMDSDGLQYFALEAWAHDVVIPGVGCPGPQGPSTATSSAAAAPAATSAPASSAAASSPASSAPASSRPASSAAPAASDVPANCHTHADGSLHCV